MRKFSPSLALVLSLVGFPAASQGVPTVDAKSILSLQQILAENKLQLTQQIEENIKLDDQIKKQLEQITLLKQQIEALTKGLDLADLGIDADFLKDLIPEFDSISDALGDAKSGDWSSVLKTGKVGGKSVNDYVTGIFTEVGIEKDDVDKLAESEDPATARIGTQANGSAFLSVAAESSSEDARQSLLRIEGLVKKIPSTANLKEALDHNTRVTAELGVALANIWQMEAIQTVGMGEAGVMDAATAADEEKYLQITGE